jgi:hypothetical protein
MHRSFVVIIPMLIALADVGCATAKKPPIPRRGEVVAEGSKVTLSFRAPAKGMVSVYDVQQDSIVHSSGVERDSVVSVNPPVGTINITDASHAGTHTVHSGLNKSHRYEIWFIQSGSATQSSR